MNWQQIVKENTQTPKKERMVEDKPLLLKSKLPPPKRSEERIEYISAAVRFDNSFTGRHPSQSPGKTKQERGLRSNLVRSMLD